MHAKLSNNQLVFLLSLTINILDRIIWTPNLPVSSARYSVGPSLCHSNRIAPRSLATVSGPSLLQPWQAAPSWSTLTFSNLGLSVTSLSIRTLLQLSYFLSSEPAQFPFTYLSLLFYGNLALSPKSMLNYHFLCHSRGNRQHHVLLRCSCCLSQCPMCLDSCASLHPCVLFSLSNVSSL